MHEHTEPATAGGPDPVPAEPAGTGPVPDQAAPAEAAPEPPQEADEADGSAGLPPGALWPAAPEAESFRQRVADARWRMADFDTVALNPDLPVSTAMAATIVLADRGPELAYHLGCNPGLAARIAGLDPLSAARELGRIEAELTAGPKRTVTAAPPPLRSLGGGENPRRDPDAMSYREYKAWRRTG